MDTFRLLVRMRLRAAWFACRLLACRLYQRWMMTAAWFTCWINRSASSSVTSLLRGATGLPCWADTGDLLFEVEETEEKFFWDFVREAFSSGTSSLAVAFRMLLK